MPRDTPDQTFQKIRQALVQEVAEKGISATSVGAVAKRAKVATGTIYLRFDSKEDMLQQVYLHIKADLHAKVSAAAAAPNSADMIRNIWFALFDYVTERPLDFSFIEFAGAAQVLTDEQTKLVTKGADELIALLQVAIDDGTLAPLPVNMVVTLLIAPVSYMARQISAQKPITDTELNQTFERIWLSIAA